MTEDRLSRQIAFVLELDALKQVLRQTLLLADRRQENDAEHSWHIAMMALLLAEHAAEPVDVGRVVKMLLIHDIVEIDAGDTFIYDEAGHADKEAREQAAADRLFGLLPADQGAELRALWDEFEARATPEARFAASIDRLQPLLHNVHTEGAAWRRHGVTADRVLARNAMIGDGAPVLWDYARRLIEQATDAGHLPLK
ncbi:MAG: HD domain-containing protein [Alphaproteobacteria bacterium]|nr:HD domain-containing protein [Alphaproteobacteria bacterium]